MDQKWSKEEKLCQGTEKISEKERMDDGKEDMEFMSPDVVKRLCGQSMQELMKR